MKNDPSEVATMGDGTIRPRRGRTDLNVSSFNESANSSLVEKTTKLKKNFNGLNHRLSAYMGHVKQNEKILAEKIKSKEDIERSLGELVEKNTKQLTSLREQLNGRIKEAVLIEAKQDEVRRDVDDVTDEVSILKRELTERRKRESSLERILFDESNAVKSAREKLTQLRQLKAKEQENRKKLADSFALLKVENATLKEEVKIASYELTVQESKAFELNKKLNHTSEEVLKKIEEQRVKLRKHSARAIEQEKQKLEGDLENVREEFTRKLQDSLSTYVDRSAYEKLEQEKFHNNKRIEEAKKQLDELNSRLPAVLTDFEACRLDGEKMIARERKRRDILNRRYVAQVESQKELCRELATYRRLVETLDAEGSLPLMTPAKRQRTCLGDLETTTKGSNILFKEDASLITERALGALTPLRKPKSEPNDSVMTTRGDRTQDCSIM